MPDPGRRAAIITLGCGRNEVDSDQVGGALTAAGWRITDDPEHADVVLVNTCTFIGPAREESVEVVLDALDLAAPVVVMGCMAQRYGAELAAELPEAAAVIGFADYPRLPAICDAVVEGRPVPAPDPVAVAPTRSLPVLPAAGAAGPPAAAGPAGPPTAGFPVRTAPRGVWAYLKIAGGCDRVCTFCAIPSFRGRFASRPLAEITAEARWLVDQGVRELVCVSENTTSWGKDLPGGRASQAGLIAALDAIEGLERVRLMYLQPAEITPLLLDAMAASRVVVGYYDLSLQHASPAVLSRMARSGGAERFLDLIAGIRRRDPAAVFRSSFIVGFPGETDRDIEELCDFLVAAQLDWAGVFTYSDEEGTAAAELDGKVDEAEARARREHVVQVIEGIAEDRAEAHVGRRLEVLVERHEAGAAVGRSHREAPDTDGEVAVVGCETPVGRLVPAVVTAAEGVDLVATPAP